MRLGIRPAHHHQVGKFQQLPPSRPLGQRRQNIGTDNPYQRALSTVLESQILERIGGVGRARSVEFSGIHGDTGQARHRPLQHRQPMHGVDGRLIFEG